MVVVPSGIEDYPYQIASGRALRFDCGEFNPPDFEAYTLDHRKVARCIGGVLRIGHPYTWNGCTGLPKVLETPATKEASAFHDLWYQYNQNNPNNNLDRKAIDAYFVRHCPAVYRPIFRAALALFGQAVWDSRKTSLIIKHL